MIVKKFIQLLMIIIVFNAPLVALYDDDEDGTPIKRGWYIMNFSTDLIEEETSKERYYGFGAAFCMLGALMSQNGPVEGVSTMVLGGFLCYRGWSTPAKDHFD